MAKRKMGKKTTKVRSSEDQVQTPAKAVISQPMFRSQAQRDRTKYVRGAKHKGRGDSASYPLCA